MIRTTHQILDHRTHKYTIARNDQPMTYSEAIALWQHDAEFRTEFMSQLIGSCFTAYRWETPPITRSTVNREFEFVLLNAPSLARSPDRMAYQEYFADADSQKIAVFDNLGKDAVLVVPAPLSQDSNYCHLAEFMRSAPETQQHALWQTVGRTAQSLVSDKPLWISTAGGGVAWLHVRMDERPKYYGHASYKVFE